MEGALRPSLEGRARPRLGQLCSRGGQPSPDLDHCICFKSELLPASVNARFMEAWGKLSVFPFQAKPTHGFWPGKAAPPAPSPTSSSMMEWEQRFGRHETRVQVLLFPPSFLPSFHPPPSVEHQLCPGCVLSTHCRREKQPSLCSSQAGLGAIRPTPNDTETPVVKVMRIQEVGHESTQHIAGKGGLSTGWSATIKQFPLPSQETDVCFLHVNRACHLLPILAAPAYGLGPAGLVVHNRRVSLDYRPFQNCGWNAVLFVCIAKA